MRRDGLASGTVFALPPVDCRLDRKESSTRSSWQRKKVSKFSTEVEYEEVSLVSYDDAGASSDISICGFNKVCAQYDQVVQTGGLSAHFYDCKDQRVRHHKQREEEASPT